MVIAVRIRYVTPEIHKRLLYTIFLSVRYTGGLLSIAFPCHHRIWRILLWGRRGSDSVLWRPPLTLFLNPANREPPAWNPGYCSEAGGVLGGDHPAYKSGPKSKIVSQSSPICPSLRNGSHPPTPSIFGRILVRIYDLIFGCWMDLHGHRGRIGWNYVDGDHLCFIPSKYFLLTKSYTMVRICQGMFECLILHRKLMCFR